MNDELGRVNVRFFYEILEAQVGPDLSTVNAEATASVAVEGALPGPPRLCPCGSGRTFRLCHGNHVTREFPRPSEDASWR